MILKTKTKLMLILNFLGFKIKFKLIFPDAKSVKGVKEGKVCRWACFGVFAPVCGSNGKQVQFFLLLTIINYAYPLFIEFQIIEPKFIDDGFIECPNLAND
jgi:hypothetical protein